MKSYKLEQIINELISLAAKLGPCNDRDAILRVVRRMGQDGAENNVREAGLSREYSGVFDCEDIAE